ncbi:MAG: glycosyltransferase family 39 protein [Lachnospiraceae bacterium]|nr:glycosyltransferase family 39 protein [Lachnospiraceae bacterium]
MSENIYMFMGVLTFAVMTFFCLYVFYGKRKGIRSAQDTVADGLSVNINEKISFLILGLIFLVFIFSRLYRLGQVPAGMHLDEIGISYDAFCLNKYGTDRFGRSYPVYPTNYGDGNSPLYTYLLMLFLKLFPWNVEVTRLPAFLCALVCFVFSYLLIHELYESPWIALLGPFFVTVIPYFFTSQRWGLDCNLMLSMLTAALFFLLHAIKRGGTFAYLMAGISMGIVLYTYVLSYVIIPLFLTAVFIYLIFTKKAGLKEALFTALPFSILALPLLLEQLVNMGIIPEFHFLISDYMRLDSYRAGEFSLLNIPKNLSVIYYCLFRDSKYTYNALNEFGPVYLCLLPLLVTGIVRGGRKALDSIKKKEYNPFVIIFFLGFIIYFIRLLIESPDNIYKINSIYLVFLIFIVEGTVFLLEALNAGKSGRIICMGAGFIICFVFLLFSEFYFRRQAYVYGIHPVFISTVSGDLVRYAEEHYDPEHEKELYMELQYENRDYSDIAVAFINQMDPKIYMEHIEKNSDSMGNVHFYFPEDFDENEDALYILGSNWGHISAYLKSIGFNSDEAFEGYTILYR